MEIYGKGVWNLVKGEGARMRIRSVLVLSLAFMLVVSSQISVFPGSGSSYDSKFNSLVQPYTFNMTTWEISTIFGEIKQSIFDRQPQSSLTSQNVVQYFSIRDQVSTLQSEIQSVQAHRTQGDLTQLSAELKQDESREAALEPIVEQTLSQQISLTLAELGIYNPINNSFLKVTFPPVYFKLENPLYVLIVSPRDKIERVQSVTIDQNITPPQIDALESSVDSLNVSSLVVQIGGMAASYPSFVVNNADLKFTIDTAVHEWFHQYLAFKPLGFDYVLDLLGVSRNNDIATINETVASMLGQEIGQMVYNQYYAQYETPQIRTATSVAGSVPTAPVFDFNKMMQQTRTNVDSYLAQGQVDQAEKYMNSQQQLFAANGYYIRKINQAYFAFYGSYADSPTSIDPIGSALSAVRQHSLSVKDFLNKVSSLTTIQELNNLINQYKS